MPFNVNNFLSHFDSHFDFAKASKFDVRILTPRGLMLDTLDLRFQCELAEIPGFTINSVDNRRYGVPEPVAATASFSDITLTFICAGDLWEKKLFDKWINLVIPFNRYNLNYKDQYVSEKIEIAQYSETSVDVAQSGENTASTPKPYSPYRITIFRAFPISVAPMQLNWGDDSVHRLAVTFKYDYWTTYDIQNQNGEVSSGTNSQPPVKPLGVGLT